MQGHETDTGDKYTDKRGVMWCGEVTKTKVLQMIDLQKDLRHPMESVVILTQDPYLQIHIPKDKAVHSLYNLKPGMQGPPLTVLPQHM